MASPAYVVGLLAEAAAVLAARREAREQVASLMSDDTLAKARELVRRPVETGPIHIAVRDALAECTPGRHHRLLEQDRLVAEALEDLGAIQSQLETMKSRFAKDPVMHRAVAVADKAMRQTRKAEQAFKPFRLCEARHHLPRPGRAPRRGDNPRRRGSQRASGVRSGQDPGGDKPPGDSEDGDPPGSLGRARSVRGGRKFEQAIQDCLPFWKAIAQAGSS